MILCPPHFSRSRGTALVVVLAFVVLLTVLVLAFFAKATAYRSLSQSAANDFRSDTLARGALALTLGDLRQEIAAGSTKLDLTNHAFYFPTTNTFMVPQRSGNPALRADGVDPIPNLVRRSVRSDAIPTPGVSSRASAASSSAASQNGRYLSPARWNKHYLIPRDPAKYGGSNSSAIGTDPVTEFVTPDWVFVTDKGPEILTASRTSVVGRYAYAIYDEGGLLDLNVAGYPNATPLKAVDASSPLGKVWGTGNKGGETMADLTVLGLTPAQINQIVGWRNFATSTPAGQWPNPTFATDSAKRYFDGVNPHPSSFLETATATATAGGKPQTDQLFTSRQQLLRFRSLVGFPQDALQYLGTFSRDLEQPAFVPHPGRARVQSAANANIATYGTGNDAYGADRDANPATDINPPLPRVLVKTAFTRKDGSAAKVGEPLVKKRFPLERLTQILRTATASKSASDPIYQDFGIYRSSAAQPWRYDHGNGAGILRLDQVASEGREPDFFELLKAAINVGSIGKSAAQIGYNSVGTHSQLQHDGHDIFTNLQLLQIGANLIDQADSDGYPTRLAFAGDLSKEVRGVESLPYLYRLRLRYAPQPDVGTTSYPASLLINPEVWNPHGSTPPADAPTRFRVRAASALGVGVPTSCKLFYKDNNTTTITINWATAGELTFNSDGALFREPTVLFKPGVPAGSDLSGPTRADTLTAPPGTLTGIVAVDFQRKLNGSDIDKAYLGQPDFGPVVFYLEYWDGTTFQTYDQMIVQWQDAAFSPKEDTTTNPPRSWINFPSKITKIEFERNDPRTSRWGVSAWDLLGLVPPLNAATMTFPSSWPGLDKPPYGPKTGFPLDKGFVGPGAVSLLGQAPVNYDNNDLFPNNDSRHRGFKQGYATQNTVRNQKGFFGVNDQPFYNRDPDGIVRRAMGGYASDAASGGSTDNPQGLPMITGDNASRPQVLNRPFRSVAELGYTFRDTPWKNLDFSYPESGDAALLDVFALHENANESALVAGRVNLNTRQAPVLQALLSGSITDDQAIPPATLSPTVAQAVAAKLVERTGATAAGRGPLINRSELVGRWSNPAVVPPKPATADPETYFSGFSTEVGSVAGLNHTAAALIPAQREAVVRALTDAGTTRTWNLLIDLVAQSGRFTRDGESLDSFQVMGEKRYWLHVAIDRFTGEILDQQLEMVTE